MTIDERLDNLERILEWLFERGTSKEKLRPPANQNKLRERFHSTNAVCTEKLGYESKRARKQVGWMIFSFALIDF